MLRGTKNTKIRIRKPQMDQNARPKVAFEKPQNRQKWPPRGEGEEAEKKCFHLNTHSDYKMYHTKGLNKISRRLA